MQPERHLKTRCKRFLPISHPQQESELNFMKKLAVLFLLLLLISACGRNTEVYEQTQIISDLKQQLDQQKALIASLQDEVQNITVHANTLEDMVAELTLNQQEEINDLDEPDEPSQPDAPLTHGLTVDAIKQDLLKNSDIIRGVLGGERVEIHEDDLHIGKQYVMAFVTVHAPYGDSIVPLEGHVFLSYHVGENEEISWFVQSHTWRLFAPMAGPPPWLENHLPISEDTTTMRFYIYHDWDIFDVIEETISREYWREEVPQLMRTHRRTIDIRDLWYEGSRLYVDLFPGPAIFFDWGSTGSWILTSTLIDSLGSLPGVAEIVVLVGGEAGHAGSHFDFSQPFVLMP